jgi:hypothetical protein
VVGDAPVADVRIALQDASARLWAYLKALSAATSALKAKWALVAITRRRQPAGVD